MSRVRPVALGDRCTGVIAAGWDGSRLPRVARPRRYVTGTVVEVYVNWPEVVRVRTRDGAEHVIRRGV